MIISIFLSGGGNSTLTKQMFSALRDYIDPTIAAISTLMILLSTGLMLVLRLFGNTSAQVKAIVKLLRMHRFVLPQSQNFGPGRKSLA